MNNTDIKISFTILTHNEEDSLKKLLEQIKTIKTVWDEVIIVDDYSNSEYTNSILDFAKSDTILNAQVYRNKLDGNFSQQKNFANSKCNNEYIFNIDADEFLDDKLCTSFKEIISINKEVEYFRLPRVNKVNNITLKHIAKWNWQISSLRTEIEDAPLAQNSDLYLLLKFNNLIIHESDGIVKYYTPIINFPDFQGRIYKNLPTIKWVNNVHEVITGYKKYANFPKDKKFSLLHYKDIKKQESQNNMYSQI